MAKPGYSDAVNAVASGITVKNGELSLPEKVRIARTLLQADDVESLSVWSRIDFNIDSSQPEHDLKQYRRNLRQAYESGIGKDIEQTVENARTISKLKEKLEDEVETALDETYELEKIARRLQDSNLGRIAGREEDEVKQLGKKLEKIDNKGKEVEQLEEHLEKIKRQLNVEYGEIHEKLGKRLQTVEKLLKKGGGNGDRGIDQLVNNIASQESQLEKAEEREADSLKDDLDNLVTIHEYKENEAGVLQEVEQLLQNKKYEAANDKLGDLLSDRPHLLSKDKYELKELYRDLEEEKKIAVALHKLFNTIEKVENSPDISADEFYQKLAQKLGMQDKQTAQQFTGRLEKHYRALDQELSKIKQLAEQNRHLDESSYTELQKLRKMEVKLESSASQTEKQTLTQIKSKLQKLGIELENEIEIEGGSTSTTNSGDSTNSGRTTKGPSSNEPPWIISISDIESNPQFFKKSLQLVEEAYGVPIVNFTDNGAKWAGNNYKLIINGDLIQHGRGSNSTKELLKMLTDIEKSSPPGRFQMTVGNHDPGLFIDGYHFPESSELSVASSEGFPQKYRKYIEDGIVKIAIPGYHATYVHAGQRNPWDKKEVRIANDLLESINNKRINSYSIDTIASSSRGENDDALSAESLENLVRKERIEKLIGRGNSSLGNGTGKNKHAGIIWARPSIVKKGPLQIVGHTDKGQNHPVVEGNLILQNTHPDSNTPSVVVEKKDKGIFYITESEGETKLYTP